MAVLACAHYSRNHDVPFPPRHFLFAVQITTTEMQRRVHSCDTNAPAGSANEPCSVWLLGRLVGICAAKEMAWDISSEATDLTRHFSEHRWGVNTEDTASTVPCFTSVLLYYPAACTRRRLIKTVGCRRNRAEASRQWRRSQVFNSPCQ